jgi:hypothetical protein
MAGDSFVFARSASAMAPHGRPQIGGRNRPVRLVVLHVEPPRRTLPPNPGKASGFSRLTRNASRRRILLQRGIGLSDGPAGPRFLAGGGLPFASVSAAHRMDDLEGQTTRIGAALDRFAAGDVSARDDLIVWASQRLAASMPEGRPE